MEKTIVIFKQSGNNLRVGNTLVWIDKAYDWCEKNNFEFFFPSSHKVLGGIIDKESSIYTMPSSLSESAIFNPLLTMKHSDVVTVFLNRCISSAIECSTINNNNTGLISLTNEIGIVREAKKNSLYSKNVIQFIGNHKIIIIDEPFCFLSSSSMIIDNKLSKRLLISSNKIKHLQKNIFGMHIRQRDYKYWLGGEHYKDNEYYNALIIGILNIVPSLQKLYIAHDGEFSISTKIMANKKIILSKGKENDVTSDFLNFTICDSIIGPISSFTRQAVRLRELWYGKKSKQFIIEPKSTATFMISLLSKYF